MSKLLRKALKSAILPASLLVTGKFISVFFLISYFGSSFFLTNDIASFFSVQLFVEDTRMALYVNSLSNLFTLLLIAIPTFYMLLRLTLFKSAQENPRIIVKLTKLNILKWVTSQKSNVITVIIWTIFLWIISGIIISSTVSLQTFSWIGVFAGVLSLLSAIGLLRTFESEIDRIYPEEKNNYL